MQKQQLSTKTQSMRNSILAALSCFIILSSCQLVGYDRVTGNGKLARQERNVGSFSKIEVLGGMDVFLSQGAPGVRVETDENLQEYILTEINGGSLSIRTANKVSLNPKSGVKVYVSASSLSDLRVTGSGSIKSQGQLTGESLSISISGSGEATLSLNIPTINASVTGSGSVTLKGMTRDFRSNINGSGDLYAFDLLSENTNIQIAGSGNAKVFASKSLEIEVSGSGDVEYKGSANVTQTVHGSGSVKKVE